MDCCGVCNPLFQQAPALAVTSPRNVHESARSPATPSQIFFHIGTISCSRRKRLRTQTDTALVFSFPCRPFTDSLIAGIRRLCSLLETSCREVVKRRDENPARGVVLFDDRPSLYAPGTTLHGLQSQGVEVCSCHMVADGACVVGHVVF